MNKQTNISVLLSLVLLLVFLPMRTSLVYAADCLSSQETRQAIKAGEALHLSAVKAAVGKVVRGDVIKAELCQGESGLVYRLVTLSRQGAVARLVLDARTGRLLSQKGR